jgi:hypothetical protein
VRVPAELEDVLALHGFAHQGDALRLEEGGALKLGDGEARAGRADAVDERAGPLPERPAGQRLDLLGRRRGHPRRLRGVGAVVLEGLAEALRELRPAEGAIDAGERGAAAAVGHHNSRATRGALETIAELGQAQLEVAPAGGLGEGLAGLLAHAVGEGLLAGAPLPFAIEMTPQRSCI